MLVKSFPSLKKKIFFALVFSILDVQYIEATTSAKYTRTIQFRYLTSSQTFVALSTVDCCRACTETADCAAVNVRTADFTCELVTATETTNGYVGTPDWNCYTKEASCQSGWTHFNGFCYIIQDDPVSWDDAVARCDQLHSKSWLLDVRSQAEQAFIEGLVSTHVYTVSYVYIGGRADGPGDVWIWRNQDELDSGFTNWGGGQPQTNDEDCVAIFPQYSYTWHDVKCSDLVESICKYRLA